MDEKNLQLAKAMADMDTNDNTPEKTVVSKMNEKQQTFR